MKTRGSIAGPLVLIVIGAIFLVRQIQPGFQILDLLARFWPFFLILWGRGSTGGSFLPLPQQQRAGAGERCIGRWLGAGDSYLRYWLIDV